MTEATDPEVGATLLNLRGALLDARAHELAQAEAGAHPGERIAPACLDVGSAANHLRLLGPAEIPHKYHNLGPGRLAERGLPPGFAERLHVVRFGEKLTLRLLGRQDLLALKVVTAVRTSILLQASKVTESGVAELRKALPHCHVSWQ